MKQRVNTRRKDMFADEFMLAYKSPGIGIPFIRMAYGQSFELIEMKNSYLVSIRGKVKRYSNLCMVAEFIYEQNFDPCHIYYPPLTDKQKARRDRKKKLFPMAFCSQLVGCFKRIPEFLRAA